LSAKASAAVAPSAPHGDSQVSSQRRSHHTATTSAPRLMTSGRNSTRRVKAKGASRNGHRMLDDGAANSPGLMP